jgi:hypothetical protein
LLRILLKIEYHESTILLKIEYHESSVSSSVSSHTNAESRRASERSLANNSLLRDFRFRYLSDLCSCILVPAAPCYPVFLKSLRTNAGR